jgi:Protein of unknown function (DUF1759)
MSLPVLFIKEFKGEQKSFVRFRDQYDRVIHNSLDFSKAQKLRYVLCYTDGKPRKELGDVTISNELYKAAEETLKKAYNNSLKLRLL